MTMRDPWHSLVDSIRRRRAPDARFFKPVCVIAAIDLANEGGLNPLAIEPRAVLDRFRTYVAVRSPRRADLGWKPLWHLSNDGLWTFLSNGQPVTPDDFGTDRKPGTMAILFNRFDRLAVNESLMPHWLSVDHRQALRAAMLSLLANDDDTCRRLARQLYNAEHALDPSAWPSEREVDEALRHVREQLDLFGEGLGVETEDPSSDDDEISDPFDPEMIDVQTKNLTIDLLLARVANGRLNLQPDFQRRWGIWDEKRQSRLIESLLLRIPLPVIYAAEDDDEVWEVVDGIQRLSTIARFMRPGIIGAIPLVLTGMTYLDSFEGRLFEDLTERLKTRLRETEIVVHLIRKGTPEVVKFNIFARINTGGIILSAQELRHAITPGAARDILADWASQPEFCKATDNSVSTMRMDDRELVLRFFAFYHLGIDSYRQSDMDGFLIRAMKALNRLSGVDAKTVHDRFLGAMTAARDVFGQDAFRKRYSHAAGRLPINKALFEAVSVNLARLSPAEIAVLTERREEVRDRFMALCANRPFESAISQGTGDVGKVNKRFSDIADLLHGVIAHA